MKTYLNRFMSLLGYVPRSAVDALRIQCEAVSASVEALKASSPLIAELRKQTTLLEVLAKQGDQRAREVTRNRASDAIRFGITTAPATGANASGMPG